MDIVCDRVYQPRRNRPLLRHIAQSPVSGIPAKTFSKCPDQEGYLSSSPSQLHIELPMTDTHPEQFGCLTLWAPVITACNGVPSVVHGK